MIGPANGVSTAFIPTLWVWKLVGLNLTAIFSDLVRAQGHFSTLLGSSWDYLRSQSWEYQLPPISKVGLVLYRINFRNMIELDVGAYCEENGDEVY